MYSMKTTLTFLLIGIQLSVVAQVKPVAKPLPPGTKPPIAKPAPAPVLKNAQDSLSYAIGVLDGTFFKGQGLTQANSQLVGKAFSDVMSGKPLLSADQANEILRREMQRLGRSKIQPNIDACNAFLAENRKKNGIKETPSGLQYEVITMGTGPLPADTSEVKVHYDGFLLNGFKFDSSRDRGEPASFPLNRVIRGWTEGVQLMPVGSRFKFYIPFQLGYGEQGASDAIPGGSLLIFDVELLEIISK